MTSRTPPTGKQPLARRIAADIRDAIIDARFEFGEALSEENLAAAFGVSRTPIREALNLLQLEDLVTIVPKSGTYIFTPGLEDIAMLCDYRAGLEMQALDLALEHARPELAEALATIASEMEQFVAAGDIRAYGRLDARYHQAIIDHAGNLYLERGYAMIIGRVSALRTQLAVRAEGEPGRSLADHKAMPGLIAQKQVAEVRNLLALHVGQTKVNYTNAYLAQEPRAENERQRLKALFSYKKN
ncbi:MAG: GntR family transcriptional regulator [Oceanospirillaceae bacterium]|uniref:GntR family transcriptional regulator n=1 Tax=Salipiger sp. HF18 TaxID=2721557 RepID=UPI00142DA942|nr:GntR family transcriptional regulator [Salipiger sp. HF18]NIY97324.1 GntR family transcriptional regulator [Salipiger sp. HF18]NVK39921.1 GntR family transcriptional regulator [Oceanospirillaceae bacterium]